MERYLVTGAGGVVGSALVKYLLSLDKDVAAVRTRSDCDLENAEATQNLFIKHQPTHVFHLAGAVFGVGGNLKFPGDAFRRNILMNTNVVEAARISQVKKIVGMGSAAMYSDNLQQPMKEEEVLSGEPHGSEFGYAFAKRALLVQLMCYRQQFGIEYAFAIATNMYGPHDRFNIDYGHVVPSLLRKFRNARNTGEVVNVWGDGSPTRDLLYADDAASALLRLMNAGEGSYNIASGNVYKISELVNEIAAHFPGVRYEWDATKPMGQLSRSYDIEKLKALGFETTFSLKEGIGATVAWLNENHHSLRE